MIEYISDKILSRLKTVPLRLWGLSLLAGLLTALACVFGVLPIIWVPIVLTIQLGMANVYLAGYRGGEVNSDDLFRGFKQFGRCAGGMAWKSLWVLIWGLIPIAGPVLAIIKSYSYRFVPYLLTEKPELTATGALRESMKMTKGYKGKMFLADLVIYIAASLCTLILGLLALIPYIGVLFRILELLFVLLCAVFLPLVLGLLKAAFYDEIDGGADPERYNAFVQQLQMQRQMKADLKAQMEQFKQQQLMQMQQQMQQPAPAADTEAAASAEQQVAEEPENETPAQDAAEVPEQSEQEDTPKD